eukprot:992981-Amphidinium_carterae.1
MDLGKLWKAIGWGFSVTDRFKPFLNQLGNKVFVTNECGWLRVVVCEAALSEARGKPTMQAGGKSFFDVE